MYSSAFGSRNKKPIKVLVVGGAGYIGGYVTDLLINKDVPFTVYDNLLYENQYLKDADFIYGDVRDTAKLSKILKDYTHVIWLAALVGDGACKVNPEITKEINQDSVEWLAKNYNGRIVFISTCSVYGKNDDEVDEDSPINPLSVYAQTKAASEEFLKDKNSIIFRLGTVHGVSDTYSRLRMDLVVNYMTANAITKGELSIFGGTQWRPLIHVRNVADAIVYSLDKKINGIYNLGTGNYQIRDLGREVAEITGCKIEYITEKFQDERNYRVSTKRAKEKGLLDFDETFDVAYSVKQLKRLVSSKRVKYTENDIYFNERHIKNLYGNSFAKPEIIKGGLAVDDRGQLTFANDFSLNGVKRFYIAENFDTSVVRAFHGHKGEAKYALVVSGSAILAAVEMDDTNKPNTNNEVHRFILSARSPSVLYIPAGYANGWKALEEGTKVMFFSTVTMEEAKGDDFRFPHDYWGNDIWNIENR